MHGDAESDDAPASESAANRDRAHDSGSDRDRDGESGEGGVDTEYVMNLTFVLTLLFGVPTVVVLSLFVPLDGWNEIILFVVRVGAGIWFLTAVGLYAREWRHSRD